MIFYSLNDDHIFSSNDPCYLIDHNYIFSSNNPSSLSDHNELYSIIFSVLLIMMIYSLSDCVHPCSLNDHDRHLWICSSNHQN